MGAVVIHDEENFVAHIFMHARQKLFPPLHKGFGIQPCLPLAIITKLGIVVIKLPRIIQLADYAEGNLIGSVCIRTNIHHHPVLLFNCLHAMHNLTIFICNIAVIR